MNDFSAPPEDPKKRRSLGLLAWGTAVTVLGGSYLVSERLSLAASGQLRKDGRPRLPPGQKVIQFLKPMGGQEGNPDPARFKLQISGLVKKPRSYNFAELRALPQQTKKLDVHCVTRWTALDMPFEGISLAALLAAAEPERSGRYLIIEAAHGYTANIPMDVAMREDNLIAHSVQGHPLALRHGAPFRAVIPDLYFWKSPKWITGLKIVSKDELGYWESRGYHRRGDPWKEERFS